MSGSAPPPSASSGEPPWRRTKGSAPGSAPSSGPPVVEPITRQVDVIANGEDDSGDSLLHRRASRFPPPSEPPLNDGVTEDPYEQVHPVHRLNDDLVDARSTSSSGPSHWEPGKRSDDESSTTPLQSESSAQQASSGSLSRSETSVRTPVHRAHRGTPSESEPCDPSIDPRAEKCVVLDTNLWDKLAPQREARKSRVAA